MPCWCAKPSLSKLVVRYRCHQCGAPWWETAETTMSGLHDALVKKHNIILGLCDPCQQLGEKFYAYPSWRP